MFDAVTEGAKLWNDQVVLEDLGKQRDVSRDDIFQFFQVQSDALQGGVWFGLVLLNARYEDFESRVRLGSDSSIFHFL